MNTTSPSEPPDRLLVPNLFVVNQRALLPSSVVVYGLASLIAVIVASNDGSRFDGVLARIWKFHFLHHPDFAQ